MKKADKQKLIEDLQVRFGKASLAVLVKNNGLTVAGFNDLRKALRPANVELKVTKNTLACRSTEGTPFQNLKDYYVGPVATAWSYGDPVAAAKALAGFLKDQQKVEYVVASLSGKLVDKNEFTTLATLPGRDELLAKMLGSMKAPMSGIVNVLAGVPRNFLNVLNAIKDTKSN